MEPQSSADQRPSAPRILPALALLILVMLAIRAPLLDLPFERDEGEYAYIGWRLNHGELPYRDWVDQKPPGVFWVYRLALALPDDPVRAVHLTACVWSAASACALFFLARRFVSGPWATAGAALFAILSAHPAIEGTAANTEIFMLLPLILSVLAWLECSTATPRLRPWLMFLCGIFIGTAMAFKQVAAVNWPLLVVLYPFWCSEEKRLRWRSTFAFALLSTCGVAFVWALILAYFHLRGALADLIYNALTHNLEYIHAISWTERLKICGETLKRLAPSQTVTWLFALAGILLVLRSRKRPLLALLAGWTLASFAGVSASGYYFPHYFQQMLPVLSVSAAFGAETIAQARFWGRLSPGMRLSCVVAVLIAAPVTTIFPFFTASPAEATRKIFRYNIFAEMPQVGAYIARATAPNDRVFVFGAEAELLFYSKRVSATRYIFLFPLYGPYRDAREKQEATAREIERNRPKVIAWFPNALFFKPDTEQFFTQWTDAYLRENFRPDIFVTRDQAGLAHFSQVPAGRQFSAPSGEVLVGIIFVREK